MRSGRVLCYGRSNKTEMCFCCGRKLWSVMALLGNSYVLIGLCDICRMNGIVLELVCG